jgi:alpha-1,6-mannosyltransferase
MTPGQAGAKLRLRILPALQAQARYFVVSISTLVVIPGGIKTLRFLNYQKSMPVLLFLLGLSLLGVAGNGLSGVTVVNSTQVIKYLWLMLIGLALTLKGFGSLAWDRLSRLRTGAPRLTSRRVAYLGSLQLFAFVSYVVLSYGLFPLVPFHKPAGSGAGARAVFAEKLARAVDFMGPSVQDFVTGRSMLQDSAIGLLVYILPVMLATGIFLSLLIRIALCREQLDPGTPKALFRWASLFALISSLAMPVLVLDFWYPVAWGRMVTMGLNPYHDAMPAGVIQDLPLHKNVLSTIHVKMMYGPLSALAYSGIMWVAGSHLLLAALLLKALIVTAWIGALRLIWLILKQSPVWHQSAGLLIFGWMPLAVMQGVAEGHNDVFVVFFMLLWIYLLTTNRGLGGRFALAASILIKYITAPLFLLDAMYHLYTEKRSFTEYLRHMVVVAAASIIIIGLFYRSPDFFSYLRITQGWHFYTPSQGFYGFLTSVLGQDASAGTLSGKSVRLIFGGIALYFIIRYWLSPSTTRFRISVLALMSGILFTVSSHAWPWYFLWILAPAAVIPESALARWTVGVALAMPFPILITVIFPPELDVVYKLQGPALIAYTFALLWFFLIPPRLFPQSRAPESEWVST